LLVLIFSIYKKSYYGLNKYILITYNHPHEKALRCCHNDDILLHLLRVCFHERLGLFGENRGWIVEWDDLYGEFHRHRRVPGHIRYFADLDVYQGLEEVVNFREQTLYAYVI